MIKDVVVKLSLDPSAGHAANYAISLAAAFGAHLTGIALAYEADILPDPSSPGAGRFLRLREESEEAASAAAAQFEQKAAAAGLVVMGGYGHSRMREFILGGVTRGMLGSMTVPTLMSH